MFFFVLGSNWQDKVYVKEYLQKSNDLLGNEVSWCVQFNINKRT